MAIKSLPNAGKEERQMYIRRTVVIRKNMRQRIYPYLAIIAFLLGISIVNLIIETIF